MIGAEAYIKTIEIKQLHCLRCGYEWIPRKDTLPRSCAGCGSPYWDIPRRAKKQQN